MTKTFATKKVSCPVCDSGRVRRVDAVASVVKLKPGKFKLKFACPQGCDLTEDQALRVLSGRL